MIRCATLFVLAAAMVVGMGWSGPTRADDKKVSDAKSTESKGTPTTSPLTINYAGTYGLDYAYLKDIGPRIARAQEDCDPVGLIMLSKELAVAEQVSGKKGPIVSDDLVKQGIEMARSRHLPAELRGVALLVNDEKTKKEFADLAKKVETTKEGTKGIPGYLIVHNGHADTVHVYINKTRVGHVLPGQTRSFLVEDDLFNDTTIIYAHDPAQQRRWGEHYIKTPNNGNNHTWNLR